MEIKDCAALPDTTYSVTLNTEFCNIHVYEVSHPKNQELVVHTDNGQKMLAEIRHLLPGSIKQVNTGDLNRNNAPELYVWCKTSADSCTLLAFELNGSNYQELIVPEKPEEDSLNYQLTQSEIIAKTKNSVTRYKLTDNGAFEKVLKSV